MSCFGVHAYGIHARPIRDGENPNIVDSDGKSLLRAASRAHISIRYSFTATIIQSTRYKHCRITVSYDTRDIQDNATHHVQIFIGANFLQKLSNARPRQVVSYDVAWDGGDGGDGGRSVH